MINKYKYYAASLVAIYSALIIYYQPPFGLMDDFKNIEHIQNLNQDFFGYYMAYFYERTFEKGLLQPFYLLQMYFQYFSNSPIFVYLQNLLIVFSSHYLFVKGISKYVKINYVISLLVFLIFPFTNDLFVHPSLQEKYAFLIFGTVLLMLNKKKKYNVIIFILSLIVPLIKLQGTVLIFIILSIHYRSRTIHTLFATLGFLVGIGLQTYITFFIEAEYRIRNSFENILSNLQHPVNLFYLLIIFYFIFFLFKENEIDFIKFSIAVSSLAILFIYINFYILGYLLSTYAFFLSLIIPIIANKYETKLNLSESKQISIFILVLIFSIFQFFMPRIQRWSDLSEVYSQLENYEYGSIYFCSEEATIYLNKIINPNNNLIYVNNVSEIPSLNNQYLITDEFQCESFGKDLPRTCIEKSVFKTRFSKILIKKISCT